MRKRTRAGRHALERLAEKTHETPDELRPREKHALVLGSGSGPWNKYRKRRKIQQPDFRDAKLNGRFLRGAELTQADFRAARCVGTDFSSCLLSQTDFRYADLTSAFIEKGELTEADLRHMIGDDILIRASNLSSVDASDSRFRNAVVEHSNLAGASLNNADLQGALFRNVDLTGADLRAADLRMARLIGCNLSNADLSGCKVYGVSTWDLTLHDAKQSDLSITMNGDHAITVDNIDVAQFMHLLITNAKLRDVIDTVTSKSVLILGRFTPERKLVIDRIRDTLRSWNYVPIVFDFHPPTSRDLSETLSILAHLSRFVIADLTDARSIPQELQRIVPSLPSVPIQPILEKGQEPYAMFEHFTRFPWVLATIEYAESVDPVAVSAIIEAPESFLRRSHPVTE